MYDEENWTWNWEDGIIGDLDKSTTSEITEN